MAFKTPEKSSAAAKCEGTCVARRTATLAASAEVFRLVPTRSRTTFEQPSRWPQLQAMPGGCELEHAVRCRRIVVPAQPWRAIRVAEVHDAVQVVS